MNKVDAICQKAWQCYNDANYEQAMQYVKLLHKLKHTSAFEIESCICHDQGQYKMAINTLKKAIRIAPQTWNFWMLLGNNLAQIRRFKEAYAAYENSLALPKSESTEILYHYACALAQNRKRREALLKLHEATRLKSFDREDINLKLYCFTLEIALNTALGEYTGISEIFKKASEACANLSEDDLPDGATLGRFYYEYAMYWHQIGKKELTKENLALAVYYDKYNYEILERIRIVNDKQAVPESKLYNLLCRGSFSKTKDFYITYHVLADTEKEAMKLIKEVENPEYSKKLVIEEANIIDEQPAGFKGVYYISEFHCFPAE